MSWLNCLILISFIPAIISKPVQPEPSESSPLIRRMDTLAGLTIGSNKATRSTRGYPRSSLDSLGDANLLRSLDSIGGQNFLRSIDSLGEILQDLDPETVARLDRVLEYMTADRRRFNAFRHRLGGSYDRESDQQLDYRTLDSLGGANLLRAVDQSGSPAVIIKAGSPASTLSNGRGNNHYDDKRLDSLSGLTLGHQKRTFDEVDRTAFDGFNKRDFDEVDRVGFDGFAKRNIRSASKS